MAIQFLNNGVFSGNVAASLDITAGSYTRVAQTTVSILSDAQQNSVLKFREDNDNYGFTFGYYGSPNNFVLTRHDNSSTGVTVMSIPRNSNNVTFSGKVAGSTPTANSDLTTKLYVDNAVAGVPVGDYLPLAGGTMNSGATITMSGNLNLTYAYPRINLTDTNNDSDYSIINNDGIFGIYDVTNNSYRLSISAAGNSFFAGDARFNSRVRIGDVTGLSNRGTVRIDTRGDAPADLLFGRDTAGTATSWTNVYWSLSSRGSSEGNTFKIYRGTAHSSPYNSEAVPFTLSPDLSATFAGNLIVNGTTTLGNQLTFPYGSIGDYIYHTGDGNTYFGFPSNDIFRVVTGGTARFEITTSTVNVSNAPFKALGTLATGPGMAETGVGLGQAFNYAHAQFSGSAGGYIDFAEPNVDWSGRIIYTHSSDSMVFYTATTAVLTLDSSNNATFAGLVSGITPTAAANFATKAYVDTTASGAGNWANIGAGTRSNYNLYFQPTSANYAGFSFTTSAGNGAGYFLIRGDSSGSGVYTPGGITLVGDGGDLTIATRTLSTSNLRFGTGTAGATRMQITGTGAFSFGTTATNYGTSGQVMTSNGNATPGWTTKVSTVSDDGGSTINVSGSATARTVAAVTSAVSSSSANLATGAQIQTAINTAIDTIPSGLAFEGNWNANTDSPDLSGASPDNGQFWIVSVAGSTNLSGITDWKVGDWAIYVATGAGTDGWQKVDNTSTLSGAGTVNALPLWTGTTSLGTSRFTQSSTQNIITGPGNAGSDNSLRVNNAAGTNQLYIQGTGEVVVSQNYFYVAASQGMYSNGLARFRGGITNDQGNLNLGGSNSTGNLTLTSGGASGSARFYGSTETTGAVVASDTLTVSGNTTLSGTTNTISGNTLFGGYTRLGGRLVNQYIANLSASGQQARQYEIARAFMDYNDWNNTGVIKINLMEQYFDEGIGKEYAIRWGYNNTVDIDLINIYGGGDNANGFECVLGTLTQIGTSDIYYLPIIVKIRYYANVGALVTTNRNLTTNATSTSGGVIYINPSPTAVNISDFSIVDSVEFSGPADNINLGTASTKVGIGFADATLPTQALDVNANMRLRGRLYDVNNNQGGSGDVLVSTGSGVDWVSASTPGTGTFLPLAGGTMTTTAKIEFYNASQYIHANSTNDLTIASGDDINFQTNYARFFNASVEHARLSSTTNSWIGNGTNSQVGINKANPTYNLDVEGTFRTTGAATIEGNVTATDILTVAGAATGNPYLQFTQGGSQKAYIQYVDSGDSFEFQTDNQFVVRTGGSTAALTINSSQNATFTGQIDAQTIEFDGIVNSSAIGALIGRNHIYDTLELRGHGAELMIGSKNAQLHINYRTCNNGAANNTPTDWFWRAGSSTSFSNHSFGTVTATGLKVNTFSNNAGNLIFSAGNTTTGAARSLNLKFSGTTGDPSSADASNSTGITWGQRTDSQPYYIIYPKQEDYNGNYSKLTLAWHTGIKIGAATNYGGTRFYSNSPDVSGAAVILNVGTGNSDVGVVNNLTVGGQATGPAPTTTTSYANKAYVDAHPGSGGTVTSVSGTGSVSGLTLTGTVTSSGNLTLGGAITGFTPLNDIRSLGVQAFTNGANPNITTAQVMAEIEFDGGFDSYSSVFKTSWSYAGNYNLTDAGDFTETAGSSWITWTDNSSDSTRGNITALAIAPNTGGSAGGVFIYNDQGAGYAPGWRQVWTNTTDGSGSGLDADLLDGQQGSYYATAASLNNYLPKANPTFTGTLSGPAATITTVTGALVGNATTASSAAQVTISYNNNSNANYQMLWGSGNNVYGTAGVTVQPYTNTITALGGFTTNVGKGYSIGSSRIVYYDGTTYLGNIDNQGSGSTIIRSAGTNAITLDTSNNATFAGDLTVIGGDITLVGTGRIQGIDTVSATTDAANKAYVDAHPGTGGTVTSVATGGGLDGGTITTTGTIEVEYDGVPTNIIQSGFDFTGDTVVPGDYMMISDPGQTTTNRRIGYVTVGDLPKAPQTTFTRDINASTWTMLCTVNGDRLASIVDLTITGTSNGVVMAASFEIIVNHYQDIHVRSMSGDYVNTSIRITSNNNEDFSIEAKAGGGSTTSVEVCVFPRANEAITPTTTDPGYTGEEYIHTAVEGWRFGGEDGNTTSARVSINGALAIGTTFPGKPLTVNGTIRAEDNNSGDYIDITNDGSVSGHSKIETSNGNLIIDPSGVLDVQANAVVQTSNGVGDFYIGNYATAKHFRFHTNNSQTYFDMNCGQINWREGSSTRYYFYPSTANMTINGTLTQNSDSRVKENVVEIDNCISKVQAMRGVYYNRTDFNTEVTKVGVIAQEVEAVLPELILEASDTGLKSVAYAELTAVLINAIKEQQEIIDDLKTRIIKLEK